MSISPDLLLAILAMDSYNRGYGSGLGSTTEGLGFASDGSEQIGVATISHNLEDAGIAAAAQAAGFYAVAYEWNGKTVISYRGTDVFNNADIENVGASDIMNGWLAAITPDGTEQTRLALEFCESVTGRDWKDGPAENVIS